MIKKFINSYNGKIIKIYQRCRILFWDSLGLGETYLTKNVLALILFNIYNIFSFKNRCVPSGSSESKRLEIEALSQNRLKTINNH